MNFVLAGQTGILPDESSNTIVLDQDAGNFTDIRDGQSYKWARYKDSTIWMVENLNFKSEDSWCYDNNSDNCAKYGRLYTWQAAKEACPSGWRLPTDNEWKKMANAYGGYYDWSTLKTIGDSKESYKALLQGGHSGFSAQVGGIRQTYNVFQNLGEHGSYWSSTEENSSEVWNFEFRIYKFLGRYKRDKSLALSCRCVKSTTPPLQHAGTFTDTRDGQTYQWVRLKDGKKWMTQNLNFETSDSWCYNNERKNCREYGRLYTWKAAQKACPDGWRLPSDEEWWTMTGYYGMAYNTESGQQKNESPDSGKAAYSALKKGGESGFLALLGSMRFIDEKFIDPLGRNGYYWTSSAYSPSGAWHYVFSKTYANVIRQGFSKNSGQSCRCLQD